MSTSDNALTRENLLREIDDAWNELQTYIASLTEELLTVPTDAAGWTVKDHIIHLAMWEQAGTDLLNGKSKRETLNITQEIWNQGDDPTNAVLQQRYHDMPLNEVIQTLREIHDRMLKKLDTMTQDDLLLPYSHYQPGSTQEYPIMRNVMSDTIDHYQEHMPWIAAIVEKA